MLVFGIHFRRTESNRTYCNEGKLRPFLHQLRATGKPNLLDKKPEVEGSIVRNLFRNK